MQEVSAVCDKIIIINKGKLVAYDTPYNIARFMEESRELHVTAKGAEETVVSAISYINGANIIDKSYDPGTNLTKLSIKMDKDTDVREQISYALMDIRCPLIEMKLHEMSLEEIFITLINSDRFADTDAYGSGSMTVESIINESREEE